MKQYNTPIFSKHKELLEASSLSPIEISRAIFIINTLLFKARKGDFEWTALSSKTLVSSLGLLPGKRTAAYKTPLTFLLDNNIIIRDNYFTNNKAYRYKLNIDLISNSNIIYILYLSPKSSKKTSKATNSKGSKGFQKVSTFKDTEYKDNSYLIKTEGQRCQRLLFTKEDLTKAIDYVNTLREDSLKEKVAKIYRLNTLTSFKYKEYSFKRNLTNHRIDSNAATLPKDLWKFSSYYNNNIDITNSQLLLINIYSILVSKYGLNPEESLDIQQFAKITKEGNFYEYVQKQLELSSREEAKELTFKMLFSQSNDSNPLKKLFPNLMESIDDFKRVEGYNQFSIGLQLTESKICIDNIYKTILKEKYKCLTTHDGFHFNEKDLVPIKTIIVEILSKFLDKFTITINSIKETHTSKNKIKPIIITLNPAKTKETVIKATKLKEYKGKEIKKLNNKQLELLTFYQSLTGTTRYKNKQLKEYNNKQLNIMNEELRKKILDQATKMTQAKEISILKGSNNVTVESLITPSIPSKKVENDSYLLNLEKELLLATEKDDIEIIRAAIEVRIDLLNNPKLNEYEEEFITEDQY